MSLPRCARCGGVAHFAELRPSEAPCHTVTFACRRCVRTGQGYPVALSDLASVIPHLGDDERTRRAGLLLVTAMLDAAKLGRNPAAAASTRRGVAA